MMVLWKNILIINQPRLHLPFHPINYKPPSLSTPPPSPSLVISPAVRNLHLRPPTVHTRLACYPHPLLIAWSDLLPSLESKPLQMGFIFWTAGGPVETTTPPAVLGDTIFWTQCIRWNQNNQITGVRTFIWTQTNTHMTGNKINLIRIYIWFILDGIYFILRHAKFERYG